MKPRGWATKLLSAPGYPLDVLAHDLLGAEPDKGLKAEGRKLGAWLEFLTFAFFWPPKKTFLKEQLRGVDEGAHVHFRRWTSYATSNCLTWAKP